MLANSKLRLTASLAMYLMRHGRTNLSELELMRPLGSAFRRPGV